MMVRILLFLVLIFGALVPAAHAQCRSLSCSALAIAQRYADSSTVVGMDSHNEPIPVGANVSAPANWGGSGTGRGTFSVAGGKIIAPNGQEFIAYGVNIHDDLLRVVPVSAIKTVFPKINFIRLAIGGGNCGGFSCKATNNVVIPWVNSVTAQHIVVEIENHTPDQRSAPTGAALAAESAQYASYAASFTGNPYVWFGTDNELNPPGVNAEHLATYNAIRGTGNNAILMMCVPNDSSNDGSIGGDLTVYYNMRNIVWDRHAYNHDIGGSTDRNFALNFLATRITNMQSATTSADGLIPVIHGEVGFNEFACGSPGQVSNPPGSCGTSNIVTSALTVASLRGKGSGAAIWLWTFSPCCAGQSDLVDRNTRTTLTPLGRFVAPLIAAGPGPALPGE
jgi:hypothetical protein